VIGSLLLEFVDGVEEVVSEGGGREGRGVYEARRRRRRPAREERFPGWSAVSTTRGLVEPMLSSGAFEAKPMHFGGITLRYENRHVSSIRHGLQREGSAAREGDFFLGREGLALAADLGFRNFTYWLAIAQTW
jgi:hypothetical protein